ncbi:RNA-binding protein [Glaciecola sp. KUL10]|uniref:RNA recognition motif domain-containing protein n=1 Tax=Glaciecola sp. (strain KUL10) TaxID=2161813 RepID=UPI000D789B8C|nr:RNA-binding protein [Glaciecola sp. KUL10]GBL05990.1 RNA-binding region RNP-1 [Glaciecola sp. KUL10]
MLFVQTRLILLASAVLAIVGYATVTYGFSESLKNYVGLSFVFGVLSSIGLTLFISKSDKQANQHKVNRTSASEAATLYVGNLPYKVNEHDVKLHFEQFGVVNSVRLMKDKRTGKRKGFGFVEVEEGDMQKMIKSLNDTIFCERTLKVRPAKDKVEK